MLGSYTGQAINTADKLRVRYHATPIFIASVIVIFFALGLGLHLRSLAQQLPPRPDLHEPTRMLGCLSEYDHLRRIFRLCRIHFFRNIQKSAVPEPVKSLMRELACVEHDDFAGTVSRIETEGGKAGQGTLALVILILSDKLMLSSLSSTCRLGT